MSCLGLEPRTVRLKAGNSTIELATHLILAYNDKWIYLGMQVAQKKMTSMQPTLYIQSKIKECLYLLNILCYTVTNQLLKNQLHKLFTFTVYFSFLFLPYAST